MENTTKRILPSELWNKYNSKSKDKKIEILMMAIDNMQSYNGRSKTECIALAMGFTTV